MVQHVNSDTCGMDTIEFTGEWRVLSVGVYRYGKCTVCGQQIREYYEYRETEVITEDKENVTIQRD